MFNPHLDIGQCINNEDIRRIFKCGNMRGMRRSHTTGHRGRKKSIAFIHTGERGTRCGRRGFLGDRDRRTLSVVYMP